MTIAYKVKTSQMDCDNGRSNALFIDNSYAATGIGIAKFVGVKADGTSTAPGSVGYVVPTWQIADVSDVIKADGLVFTTSPRAVDTTVTDWFTATDANFYPYGDRETKPLSLVRKAEIVVRDSTRDYFFNTTKKTLTGTVEVGAGTLTKIDGTLTTFTTQVRVGDYVIVNGVERQVSVVNSAVQLTVSVAFAGAIAAATAVYLGSDLFKPIYLAEAGEFKKLVPLSGAGLKQVVGYVINGNNVYVDLDLDTVPTIV